MEATAGLRAAEAEELERLGALATSVHQANETICRLAHAVSVLDKELRALEQKIGFLHTPFSAAVFQTHQGGRAASTTDSPAL